MPADRESLVIERERESGRQDRPFRGERVLDQLPQPVEPDSGGHEEVDLPMGMHEGDLDHDVTRPLLAQNRPSMIPPASTSGTATTRIIPNGTGDSLCSSDDEASTSDE